MTSLRVASRCLLLAAVVTAAVASCPAGFQELADGNCVHLVKAKQRFSIAKRTCAKLGATLPILTDVNFGLVLSQFSRPAFWLGMTDSKKEGKWTWDNGKALAGKYWSAKDPNGGKQANCAIVPPTAARWVDVACDRDYNVVCVKMMNVEPKRPASKCPDSWAKDPVAGKCTGSFTEPRTYEEAKKTCEALHATLSVAKSKTKAEAFECTINLDHRIPAPVRPPGPQVLPPRPSTGDKNPTICQEKEKAGKLKKFCKTETGKTECAETCTDADQDPAMCKKMKDENKLTKKFCKKGGKKSCKLSCKTPQEGGDKSPEKCQAKQKEGTIADFCKGKKGKKECKATCASLD